MTNPNPDEQPTATAAVPAQEPLAAKKANTAPGNLRVAPTKPKTRKGAHVKKNAKVTKRAPMKFDVRKGSKTAKVLDLLKRPGGASLKELVKATGWQPHSVRGFMSGTLGKKMGLKVESSKGDEGNRVYTLAR